jgi:predicted outer membrane protein
MSVIKYSGLVCCLVCASSVFAQNTTQEYNKADPAIGRPTGQAQVGQLGRTGQNAAQAGNEMDSFIASCLLLGNQEEVALAQLASQKAQNPEVKQFAQMMIEDHQKAIQKLQQHAKPGISIDGAARQTVASTQAGSANLDKVLQLSQQAAQECLSMTKSELQQKQGAEFDKAFIGSQVGAHIGMLAKLKASEQHASPELASLLNESSMTVKSHFEKAKQICKDLESSADNRQARRQ